MEDLIDRFENTRISREEWRHEEHLRVALHYLQSEPLRAEERMRQGIQRLNASLGIEQTPDGGYHETLTLAWLRALRSRLDRGLSVDEVLAECADKRLLLRHYSRERLLSWEARTGWLEPDLEDF